MALNIMSYSERERSHSVGLVQPTDEQVLLNRFPEEGLVIDAQRITEATLKESSRHRSRRWIIGKHPNLKQIEVMFSRRPKAPFHKWDGIILRGNELSVYFQQGEISNRKVFSGFVNVNEPPEVKIALMRALRTIRLAPRKSR